VDPASGPHAGPWRPPRDLALHLGIYRARPDVGAVLYAQPRHVQAFLATEAEILPLTHGESDLVIPPLPRFGRGELITTPEQAYQVVDALAGRQAVLLPGQGAVFVGESIGEAAARCYQLELLAGVNTLALALPKAELVSEQDAQRVAAQRAPADDYLTYLGAVAGADPAPLPREGRRTDALDEDEIRAQMVAACRVLYRHGLVEHLEHVSHRLPNGSGFLITPRGHMGRLRPDHLARIDGEGRWVGGPLAPPPFLWLHRDMFRARPEVQAIVHTHQPYARAYAIAGEPVVPLYRAGARWLRSPAPIYPVPDLIFDEEHRRGTLDALASGNIVHERSHGTDFLGTSIEQATAAAVHYERAAWLQHQARPLGRPRPLPDSVLDRLEAEEPSDEDWWRDLLAELEVPA
jgi:ribulose-5-phosphate 4-epimerase/fuculose-1-phosphate aldolase